jgi:hypothetical protein
VLAAAGGITPVCAPGIASTLVGDWLAYSSNDTGDPEGDLAGFWSGTPTALTATDISDQRDLVICAISKLGQPDQLPDDIITAIQDAGFPIASTNDLKSPRGRGRTTGGELLRGCWNGDELASVVDADHFDRSLDEELAVGLAVSLLDEADAILTFEATSTSDLEDVAKSSAVFENHRGLVDHEPPLLLMPQPRELLCAERMLACSFEIAEVVCVIDEAREVRVLVVDLHVEQVNGVGHEMTMPAL